MTQQALHGLCTTQQVVIIGEVLRGDFVSAFNKLYYQDSVFFSPDFEVTCACNVDDKMEVLRGIALFLH